MESKKYGLSIPKKAEPKQAPLRVASVFGDDDDDDEAPATATNAASASVIRVQKAAEREHQKAQAEDPSIFDYDSNYDEIQAIKNEKKEEARKADKTRDSKYAENIMKAHARRQLEQFSREERQQLKEREKEGDEFADKETFVTGAYRKQQEEVKKYREKEAQEAAFNDMTSVQHQKMWQMGIGRTLLDDIARDPTAIKQRKEKQKNVRQRTDQSPSPTRESEQKKEKEVKKSIYSDEEEEVDKRSPPPRQKNFEGELKPGLNKVTKKATTHAERIRQRNFTPTPSSSDDEGGPPRRRRSPSPRDRRSRERSAKKNEEEDVDVKPEIRKISLKEKLKPKKIDKVARLKGLKEILKQRNTEKEIKEAQQRQMSSEARPPSEEPTSSSNPNQEESGRFECNICLDSAKDAVVSLCGHLFCWPCLSQWLDTRPNNQLCPVCKSAIDGSKVVPIYGRGGDSSDPRSKVPPRPKGQRSEPPPPSFAGFNWGGDGMQGGNVHFSFGIGIFPLSFIASFFGHGNNLQQGGTPQTPPNGASNAQRVPNDSAAPGSRQAEEDEWISNIFKYIGFFMLFWLLFV
ncbi:unnamed protein product [Caenorhabditis sp. 36 PRJEB53466]|nr:unnamed protein product [Caenorhabditis sp. 36 PRJEB53466]